jgi:hypothetical protein
VEYPLIKPGQFLDVTDPIRLMNVYGYTLCFCSAAGMEAVWRQAGLEAREFGLPGHVSNEVWFDGAYHYLDMEFKGCLTRADGVIASARECGLKPAEIVVSSRIPSDFFPLTRYPFRSYLSRMVFAGLLDGGPSWYASHRANRATYRVHVTFVPENAITARGQCRQVCQRLPALWSQASSARPTAATDRTNWMDCAASATA